MLRKFAFALAVVASLVGFSAAWAFPNMQKAFLAEHLNSHEDAEYVKFMKTKVKCWICHQGKNRHHHNPYGEHLAELVDMKKDGKDLEKLTAALKKVAAMHSVEGDDKSPTYGDLIKQSKPPGGPLEECMKEPEGDEAQQ